MFRCPPPLLGRNAENLSKITIKSGYCCESAVQCNVTYGGICLSQLFARCPDPNPVDIFHRRHPHGFLKNTAQMCLTDVAHIRKFFNPDALVEIFPDIIERRKNQGNAGIIQNGILFLRLIFFIPSRNLHQKRPRQPLYFFQIKFLFFIHAFNNQFDQLRHLRSVLIFRVMSPLVDAGNQLLCHTRIILIQFCDKAFHINKQPCPGAQTVFL